MNTALPPNLDAIEAMARAALEALPEAFQEAARRVVLRVEDFPSERMMAELNLADPFELTGLYEGIPLTEKSMMDQPTGPDIIWLFRRPILDEWCERETEEIATLVAHVLVHELAHHFGWSDEDIATIDRWWD